MIVQGKNLFPLKLLTPYMDGYFMDGTGNVFSTKQGGNLSLLKGSNNPSGHYYSLNRNSHRADALKGMAMRHAKFKTETEASVATPHPQGGAPLTARAHAVNVDAGIKARGWVIGTVHIVDSREALAFGSHPVIHVTLDSVMAEMKRLAMLKPGVKFVKLKIEGGLLLGGMTAL